MSAVILKVAEPLVKKYANTPEQAKTVIMLVIYGWNKSLFPPDKQAVVEKEILARIASEGGKAEIIAGRRYHEHGCKTSAEALPRPPQDRRGLQGHDFG